MLPQERGTQISLAAPPPLEHEGNGIALREIFAMLRRRKWLILFSAILGTGLAIGAGHWRTPEYTATASLLIDPLDGQILNTAGPADPRLQDQPQVIATHIELMTSRSQIAHVMHKLALLEEASTQPEPKGLAGATEPRTDRADAAERRADDADTAASALPAPIRRLADHLPKSWLVAAGLAKGTVTAPPPVADPEELEQAAIDRFRRDLEIGRPGPSMVITVSYTATDPDRAAQVANAVASTYVQTQLQRRRQAAEQAAGWFDERLEELRETVRSSEQAAAEFRVAHRLAGPAGRTVTEQRQLDLRQALSGVRGERMAKEAKLLRARELRAEQQNLEGSVLADSPLTANLRLQKAALLRERAELAQTYGERHPRMINLRAQIAEIDAKIQEEIERGIRSLEDELAVLRNRERSLLADLEEAEREEDRSQQDRVRLAELERQAEANRQHYEALLRRSKATQEQEKALLPQAQVISPAVPPRAPSTPGPRVFAMVGFTVSTMLAVFLALVLERVNGRVRSAAALESALGVPALGLMPRLPSRRARRRTAQYIARKPLSEVTEAARSILTTVRLAEPGTGAGVLLVTSALPKEGKTTLAVALAASAAASGYKVLLVDLDLRRPMVAKRLLKSPPRAGLVDYLSDQLPRDQLVQRDPDSGLDFIPAGRPADYPLTMLQGPRIHELLAAARTAYDYVILDSAPLLAVAEARVATRLADRVIVATRWRRTPLEAVGQAVRSLLQVQAVIAGCVLTDVAMRKYRLYGADGGNYYSHYRTYYTN